MPLTRSGSKAAVGKNISRELQAGKPLKQAQAIALSTQRRAKAQHLSAGGEVEDEDDGLDGNLFAHIDHEDFGDPGADIPPKTALSRVLKSKWGRP